MPKLMDATMEELKTASNYKFSGVKVDELGAPEYSLVTIAQDVSGSVTAFKTDMEECLKTIVEACQKSPRAENLMLRLITFDDNLTEIHGFKLLNTVQGSNYNDSLTIGGCTSLFDAVESSIEATCQYAKILKDQDFLTNAIVFVITDGMDNASKATINSVKKSIEDTVQKEVLESITTVLVGVGNNNGVSSYLSSFQRGATIDQFVDIGDTTPKKLAKLANFVSRSISSTSQSLGTGSQSQLLTF